MQKTAEKEFAIYLQSVLNKRGWSQTRLLVEANSLSSSDKEIFGPRSLQNWLEGKNLPNHAAVKAIALATGEPSLISKLYSAIELSKKQKNHQRCNASGPKKISSPSL